MRKDVGVDGDAQRISQLGWMLFLKILDDSEQEAELLKDDFKSPISIALECEDEVLIADPVAGTIVQVRLRNRRTSSASFPMLTPNSIVKVCNPLPVPEPDHRSLALAEKATIWR